MNGSEEGSIAQRRQSARGQYWRCHRGARRVTKKEIRLTAVKARLTKHIQLIGLKGTELRNQIGGRLR
jgi:hypothetical protein